MKICSLMILKPITITADAAISEAIELMKINSIRHLPVISKGNMLLGFITLADLKQGLIPSMLGDLSLRDLMIKDPISGSPDDDIELAAQLIYNHKIGGMPVVKDGRLTGIITATDILRTFIDMMGILSSTSRIDVVVGDLGKWTIDIAGLFNFRRLDCKIFKYAGQLVTGFLDTQSDKPERAAMVENNHQDNPLSNDRNVNVVFFPFVEEDGELFLANQFGESACGSNVAGGQRGKTCRVKVLRFATASNQLPVFIDQEDDFSVGFTQQFFYDCADPLEFLVVHDKGVVLWLEHTWFSCRVGLHQLPL